MISSIRSDYSIEAILAGPAPHSSREQQPASRRRRTRTVFSWSAIKHMEREFEQGRYPDIRRREVIAADIGVSEARVQVWFQNRRARHNKRSHPSDTCPDGSVPRHSSKRQRRVEKRVSKSPDTAAVTGLATASSSQSCLPGVCHSLQTQVVSPYPSTYFYGLVLPSLWNLQRVCTSLPQETKNESDEADDIVKRLFRFSARDYQPAALQEQVSEQQQKQVYRMVVPTKKATDCSVTELRIAESTRDAREESVFTLEDEDSGLANDSFSDSM